MCALSTIDKFVSKVVNSYGELDLKELRHLSPDDKFECTVRLLNACDKVPGAVTKVVRCVSNMIPYLRSEKRFFVLNRIVKTIYDSEGLCCKDFYNVLDSSVVRSLQPLELISLANVLSDTMQKGTGVSCESSLWGLIRIIPAMHSINQREYAHDIFLLHSKVDMQHHVLDGLTSLIYNMEQVYRTEMTFFFADVLRKTEDKIAKIFAIDLLHKVTPALPENDRTLIADSMVPLIYTSEMDLVKKTVIFLSSIIGLLPMTERSYYTEMISGVIHQPHFASVVIEALERALPFLGSEAEKNTVREVLRDAQNQVVKKEDGGFVAESVFCEVEKK